MDLKIRVFDNVDWLSEFNFFISFKLLKIEHYKNLKFAKNNKSKKLENFVSCNLTFQVVADLQC